MYTEEQVRKLIEEVMRRSYNEGFEDGSTLIRNANSVKYPKQKEDNTPGNITININVYNK